MKIAIFGSAVNVKDKKTKNICNEIAKTLVEQRATILTGVGIGIPHLIVEEAHKAGGRCIGYSPATDEKNHQLQSDNADLAAYNTVHFIQGFTRRSIAMIEEADAVIVIGGRMGTLSEYSIAYEENKPIGVLTSVQGIGKHLQKITTMTKKHRKTPIYFDNDAQRLVRRLVKE